MCVDAAVPSLGSNAGNVLLFRCSCPTIGNRRLTPSRQPVFGLRLRFLKIN